MTNADLWQTIHAQRAELVSDLKEIPVETWATASLCTGWSVRDVLAHMTATAKLTPPKFFVSLAGAGFRFETMTAKGLASELGVNPGETLVRFEGELNATTHPPGPLEAMVGEAIVHSADIRRPLGIAHTYPTEMLIATADFYRKSNLLLGGKRRVAGLKLRANDADWTVGDGPEVTGPMLSFVQVIAGRKAALEDLSGEGMEVLRSRP